MTYASEWLVELDAHNGSEVVTLRYSVSGFTTQPSDIPTNVAYDARIGGLGTFAVHLCGAGRTRGQATVEMSDLTLSNADGDLDALKNYAVDGRRFSLKRMDSPFADFSTATTVLTGTMEGVDASSGSLTLLVRFYDRRRDLEVPLQEDKFAGTTTEPGPAAEGAEDMKDRIKPLIFGRCFSVPATIVNDFNLFLMFSAGPVASIVLYDGGVPLINDGDVANLTALAAATGNPGHYRTCLAEGIARPFGAFNGRPAFTWTADVTEGATAADRRAASIVKRMLARIGIDDDELQTATFTALNSLATAELGFYIDNETTVLNATHEILRSVGGYMLPDENGKFVVGRIDQPGVPIRTLTDPEILTASAADTLSFVHNPDTDGAVPAHSVLVRYKRHWHVHSDSDLGGCVNFGDPVRGSSLKQEWREVTEDNPAVLARHLLSREMEVETLIVEQADAQAEAVRLLGMYGVHREVVMVGWDLSDADDLLPSKTVTLVTDRFDYSTGKTMLIIGREDDFAQDKTVLTLWG